MKHPIALGSATAVLLACTGASTAGAAAVPVIASTDAGDQTVAFDGSASICEFGPCGYNWRWNDGSRLGVTIGSGVAVSFRFPLPGWHMVTLKVSQHCYEDSSSWCWRSLSEQVFVPEPPPVVAPDPPVVTDPAPAIDPLAAPAPVDSVTVQD